MGETAVRWSLRSQMLWVTLFGVVGTASGQDRSVNDPCQEGSSPILILGTYHMANPGLDAYNVEADDVLSARRQEEIR